MRDTADLRAWFREDIARMLTSINSAQYVVGAQHTMTDNGRAFSDGFTAALGCVALAVGIDPDDVLDWPVVVVNKSKDK